MTVLDDILAAKRDEVAARRAATPPSALRERPLYGEARRGFRAALAARPAPAVIAELKRASPSRGEIRAAYDPAAIARGYAAAGLRVERPRAQRRRRRGGAPRGHLVPLGREDVVEHGHRVRGAPPGVIPGPSRLSNRAPGCHDRFHARLTAPAPRARS